MSELDEILIKYKFALNMLETEAKIMIEEFEYQNSYNPVEHIKLRLKTKESILKKLIRKNYDLTLDNIKNHIHDIVGLRIVCSFESDVYDIVGMIKNSKSLIVKKEKDYIKNPKESGYSSYHIIVDIPIYLSTGVEYIEAEIQIRTVAMDFWASLDHKIQYKFPNDIPNDVRTELFNCSKDIRNLDKKMAALNNIVNKYKK